MKPSIRVGVALIEQNGHYLIARRKVGTHLGGLWEFPGGKCEDGELLDDCTRREVLEELDIEVSQPCYFMSYRHEYSDNIVDLTFFTCSIVSGVPRAQDCADFCWVKPAQFCEYQFPPADTRVIKALCHRDS